VFVLTGVVHLTGYLIDESQFDGPDMSGLSDMEEESNSDDSEEGEEDDDEGEFDLNYDVGTQFH
jgi:hypothetical protein